MHGNTDVEYLTRTVDEGGQPALTPIRILIVTDDLGPTLNIYFKRATKEFVKDGVVKLRVVDEATLEKLDGDTSGPEVGEGGRRALRSLFATFQPNLVIFCRYGGRHGKYILSLARETWAQTCYFLDDALFAVPIRIGIEKYRRRMNPFRISMLSELIRSVDCVYASTEAVARHVRAHVENVSSIYWPRAIGYVDVRDVTKVVEPPTTSDEVCIGFAGTSSHSGELHLLESGIEAFLMVFPKGYVEFFGNLQIPQTFSRFGGRIRCVPKEEEYDKYLLALRERSWMIGLVPLMDDEFNGCKSTLKWLEYTNAGCATIASPVGAYGSLAKAGMIVPVVEGNWSNAILATVLDSKRRAEVLQASIDHVNDFHRKEHAHGEFLRFLAMTEFDAVLRRK